MNALGNANRAFRLLLWALISGAAVRIFFIEVVLPDEAFEGNGIVFLEMAQSLQLRGDPFSLGAYVNRFDRGPLSAYVISLLASFMDLVPAGRYASALSGIAIIGLTFFIARRIVPHDERVAGFAALTTAWFPLLIEYSSEAYNDMLACLMFMLLVAVLVQAAAHPRKRLFHAALIGGVAALGYLTRPSGLAMVAVIVVVWVGYALHERSGWRGWLLPSVISVAVFAVMAAPYAHFLSELVGRFTLTAKAMVNLIWITESPERNYELIGNELVWAVAMRDMTPGQYIATHWQAFLPTLVKGVQLTLTDHIGHTLSLPIAVMAFLGFVNGPWDSQRVKTTAPILLSLLALVVPLSVFGTLTTGFGRYLLPIIPIALIWFCKALFELTDKAGVFDREGSQIPWSTLIRAGSVALVGLYLTVGTLAGPGLKLALSLNRQRARDAQIVGEWIRSNTPDDAVVCTNDPAVSFASARKTVPEPVSTAETTHSQVTGYLARQNVDYVVVAHSRPNKRSMSSLVDTWPLVFALDDVAGGFRVYRRRAQSAHR